MCNDGKELDRNQVCNGERDCMGGEDEAPAMCGETTQGPGGPSSKYRHNGVLTLAWYRTRTGTGTRTSIVQSLSYCTGTWKNGLYDFNENLSY